MKLTAFALFITAAYCVTYTVFFCKIGFPTDPEKLASIVSGLLAPLALFWVIIGYFQNNRVARLQAEKDIFLNFASKVESELSGNVLNMHRMLTAQHNSKEFMDAQKRNLDDFALGNRNIIIHSVMSCAGGEKGEGFKNHFSNSRAKMYFNIAKKSYVELFSSLLTEASKLSAYSDRNLLLEFYKKSEFYSLYKILELAPDVA